ncbi:MAG: glycosyltransferase [Ignavibacteria bacterium]|nr:glycosyltransferase [Ignavibacteria bacterium]
MHPVISIVIPVLQEEKLLETTLLTYTRPLREQFKVELIISDGGSTDASLEIASRYADVVLQHDGSHRQTIAEGRNCGAAAARGQVLVFINADTVPADAQAFFNIVNEFAYERGKYRRASALACPVRSAPQERSLRDVLFHEGNNLYVQLLNILRIGAGRGECQIVRRDVFEKVGGYRTKIAAGEDFDLFARIGLIARVRFAPNLLVFESPRRFLKFGYFRVLFWWMVNALSVMIIGKSSSDEWEPVR